MGGGRRKGIDEGEREETREGMWGRSEGRRKGKIYWWPLTFN